MASNEESNAKKQCVEDKNVQKKHEKSFTPREYQIEILQKAKETNTIACLGTGTGKTFIAVMLIREMSSEVRLPFDDGGKRIFFLVPTVPLVHQQEQTIKDHTDLIVKGYSGDMNVDSWNHEKWVEEFQANQVLVMTAEIFRIIVDHTFIHVSKIKLLIIDECHRAQGDHPYRQAMKRFTDLKLEEMPRIFGLSASLINGKCKPTQVGKQLAELEKTLRSTITTASDIADLQKYGADPDECVVYYKQYLIETDLFVTLRNLKEKIKKEKKDYGELDVNSFPTESELIFFDKPLRCLNALEKTLEFLGPWCAHKAAEIFCEELTSLLLKCLTLIPNYRVFLTEIKDFLITFMEKCKTLSPSFKENDICKWPHKLQRLLEIFMAVKRSKRFSKDYVLSINAQFHDDPEQYHQLLQTLKDEDNSNVQICSIIFVEQRITAYVLLQWILEMKKVYPELNFINPDFVVGHGSTGIKTSCMSEKQQKKALKDFRSKKCNVLISTNVLEEGMDVQQCNIVVRFDLPFDFRAYVQSKGRARAKNSVYILMVEAGEKVSRFWADMGSFKTVEKMLLEKCHDRVLPDEEEIKEHMAEEHMPPYMPYGPDGPRITMISAISLINRYCSNLPSDMATKLTAKWSIKVIDEDSPVKEYECSLKMPINSPLRSVIIGPVMPKKKLAKMAVALKACEELNKIGELNEYLVPISCLVDKALEDEIGPVEEEDGEGAIPGTNRRRQIYDKHVPVFFKNSKPQPLNPCYLHIIEMELVEPLSDALNPRKRPIINPADTSRGLGILLSKKLPVVNPFPVFTKFGKVKIRVALCDKTIFLSEGEIQEIEKFHKFIFADALYLHRGKCFSPESAEMSYYIVPVNKDFKSSSSSVIDWEFIKTTAEHPYNFQKLKTAKTVGSSSFSEEILKDAVLLKSYMIDSWKSEKPTFHHVICITDMFPTSLMDSKTTFKEYYKSKYGIEIQNDHQHLVETYQNSAIHQWKPIYINVRSAFDDKVTLSKSKQKHQSYREYLVPELCLVHPFPSSYFNKVLSLPSILFRLQSLLLAEELRQAVAASGLVGRIELGGFCWPYFHLETSDKSLKMYLKDKGEKIFAPRDKSIPQDIMKSGKKIIRFVNNIDLHSHAGPNPSLLLQALTSKSTGDEFDLERLEMIGDSFLKYVMSVKTFMKYDNYDEGKLTRLRSGLIQNKHLYQKAKKRNLPMSLICTCFSCSTTWLPPCYTVEEEVNKKILNKKSKSEQEAAQADSKNHFFKKQIISDKCIADSVEALIGAYLLSCGQKGAIMFMSWLGLNPLPHKKDDQVSREDFENWPPVHPDPIIGNKPNVQECLRLHIDGFHKFEAKINYKFRDKALLLQAFTHPSYSFNEITDCYQRLEFLGDAVLDFLITRYLFEDPNDHSPGELTDLRSALVNNIYFASLAVKYEYNKYLKMLSPILFGQIKQYVELYRDTETFKFFERHGYHLEEIECFALDEVEVPKALGDVFESVAGAIYLDSGRSLDAVWKVCYPMMKNQINHLTEHVPKSPVRELYEVMSTMNTKEVFTNFVQKEAKAYIEVKLPNGKKVIGVGPNKKVAKRSAAKRALAELKHQEEMDID